MNFIAWITVIEPKGAAAAGAAAVGAPAAAAPPHGMEKLGFWFTGGATLVPPLPSYDRRQLVSAIVMVPVRDGTTRPEPAARSESIAEYPFDEVVVRC